MREVHEISKAGGCGAAGIESIGGLYLVVALQLCTVGLS